MSLRLSELHEIYRSVDPAEARLIANLGAEVYVAARDRLREAWSAEMSAEEGAKADVWRTEGRVAALEEVKGRLATAEEAVVRAAAAEGTVSALRAAMETEVTRRVEEMLAGFRKDYDLEKMKEMTTLREQIAAAKPKEELLAVLREKVTALEAARDALQTQLMDHMAAATKSSHVIGKAGEATVWEIIETAILPEFLYAEAKNMSGVSHAADFHLWVMNAEGRRVKILIDSKKYKRAVNSDEIAKLNADVDADEEADCGILVSLASGICTKKQFQIGVTPKRKPILYLSFQDMSPELQRDTLCWSVRVLVATTGERDGKARDAMLENVDAFVTGVEASVKEIDAAIRVQMKAVESMRDARRCIMENLAGFKGDNDGVVEHVEDGCSAIVKATGARCGRRVVDGERCGNHRLRKHEGAGSSVKEA